MRVFTFQEMSLEYEKLSMQLDPYNLKERDDLSKIFKYSVVVEGEENEIESLEKWFASKTITTSEGIYYGKIDYNFHFVEFFLNNENDFKSIVEVVPNIYTTFPNSFPTNQISKSSGPKVCIDYSENDLNAVII